jgi:tripartite-type tricarboxylate transporter receptor subunit TctC
MQAFCRSGALCQKPSAAASEFKRAEFKRAKFKRAVVMNVFARVSISRVGAAAAALFAIGVAVAAVPARPDDFPSRPIHLIVNFAPGGTGDIVARLVGAKLSAAVGQSVVVENRPGAGGTLGARDVVNAEPDGYTLTVAQTPEIAINPFFMKDAGYDPRKDMQPIALAGIVPLALVVPENAPFRRWRSS